MIAVRRTVLIVVSLVVLWRIVAVGLAQYYVDRSAHGDETAAAKALTWHGSQPEALLRQARQRLGQDPAGASEEMRRAYRVDPADPDPLLALTNASQKTTSPETAEAYIHRATQLAPANPSVASRAAAFWLDRGDLSKAMQYWSRALEADPGVRKGIFRILLAIAEDPQARLVFADYAPTPPTWWQPFFAEVAQRALDVETVRFLYALRRDAAGSPISEAERGPYISRLQREGMATEAYLVWVNGLDDDRRRHLGLLYNGGFEVAPTDVGFDWRRIPLRGVVIGTAKTFGSDGDRSLHLLFQGTKGPFRHLVQDLYLQPGAYRVYGRVRPDGLKGTGGLQWALRCGANLPPLATSERFIGSGQWRDFSFSFELPQGCQAPQILLQSAGERPSDHDLTGAIWFDALRIRTTPSPTPPPPP